MPALTLGEPGVDEDVHLVFAEPPTAVVLLGGRALAPFAATAVRFVRDYETRVLARVATTLAHAQDEAPDLDLEAAGAADPARVQLTARGIGPAGRTPIEDKLRALGTVLAWGLNPAGRVDEALLLAAALDDLEVFHVAVLKTLRDADRRVDADQPGWKLDAIGAAVPELGVVASTVLRTLERHDLVRLSTAPWPSDHSFAYHGPFAITAFGLLCLELLEHRPLAEGPGATT